VTTRIVLRTITVTAAPSTARTVTYRISAAATKVAAVSANTRAAQPNIIRRPTIKPAATATCIRLL
jgi:hypothetical protein